MNKLLAIIAIISITVLSVNGDQAVPGYSVSCGTANGSACVSTCTGGATADSNQICQPPIPGISVSCGTANGSVCVSTCTGGATADSNQICQPPIPGTAVSCGADLHVSLLVLEILLGSTCVASCPQGQTADSNNICQINSQSQLLALALSILFLCLLF
ncbi:hypothetical protein ABPG74_018573 [Tetrahymena malaccensis]